MLPTRFRVAGFNDPDFTGLTVDLGPTHPSAAGVLTGALAIEDETIVLIDPQPGALHRGAELLFPARDYRQCLSLANRHDWQAPFFGEWALGRLVESALGVEVPRRARTIRAIIAEHQRIGSHLGYLSFLGARFARPDLAVDAVREEARVRLAELTGNRVHPMAVRLGGVACDVDAAWADAERGTVARAAALAGRLGDALADEGWGRGVAVVARDHVDAFGLAGPVARASGVRTDLRRGDPAWASCADLLVVDAPTTGDAQARWAHLAAEVVASAAMVDRMLDELPDGPLTAHLPKVVKLPDGDHTAAVEAPLGRAGVVVTSRGEKTPWRLRLRTPSAANVSAWAAAVPGTRADDLALALASLPWVAGDLDK